MGLGKGRSSVLDSKFEVPIQQSSVDAEKAVGYMSLEFKGET